MPHTDPRSFRRRVLDWQHKHGRHELPWQQSPDPYRVWVSEIMLQQTQVSTVIPYYSAFMERFPTLSALAAADVDEVLAHWSGLGYYARARNLHRCAREVVDHHQGQLPCELQALEALPGIGRSTAGAIRSLGCGKAAPILDGNVKRVLARHAGIDGWPGEAGVLKQLWAMSEQLTPTRHSGRYNQAMMDLGATLCTRRNPACVRCPISQDCVASMTARTHALPAPRPKRTAPHRHAIWLRIFDPEHSLLLERRPSCGLWGGLWSLPQLNDLETARDWLRVHINALAARRLELEPRLRLQHSFTHFTLHIEVHDVQLTAHMRERALRENAPPRYWWTVNGPLPGGIAAPLQRVLSLSSDSLLT